MKFSNFDPQLLSFLQEHHLSFEYYEHPPLFTVEDSKKYGVNIPGAHTKNLFLTDKKGGFYLLSVEGSKRVAINQFRKQIGLQALSFASPEQLLEILGLTPGSVSIMGLLTGKGMVKFYIDEDLREAKSIGVHPNRNDATIVLSQQALRRFLEILNSDVQVVKVPEIESKL